MDPVIAVLKDAAPVALPEAEDPDEPLLPLLLPLLLLLEPEIG